MRKLLTGFVVCCMCSAAAYSDLFWYSGGAMLDESGVALPAHETDYTIGCFAQLIYTGPDGAPNTFSATGDGLSGDDSVVSTMFAGQTDPFYSDGYFILQSTAAVSGSAGNGDYYVRVFNAPSEDFTQGTAAEFGAATYYWQSEEHTYTHSDTTPDNWIFDNSVGGQTLVAIPEPTILAFGFLGLLSVRFSRKFMKK